MAKKKIEYPVVPPTFLPRTDERVVAAGTAARQMEAISLALSLQHWIILSGRKYLKVDGLIDRDVLLAGLGDCLGRMMVDMPRFIVDEFMVNLVASIRGSYEHYNKVADTKKEAPAEAEAP